jgi:hypothetical protein
MLGVDEQVIQRFRFRLRLHTESLKREWTGRKRNWTFCGQSADTESPTTGTWIEHGSGLSEDMESSCPFHARARSASMDCPWTWIVPGLCAVVARTASRLANRMPTRPLCDLLRGLHRHLPGHLPTVERTFIGCCMRRFPPLPGHCVAAAQMLRRTLRVCCVNCCADAARLANRLLRVCQADCFPIC